MFCCEGSGKGLYILIHLNQVGFVLEVDKSTSWLLSRRHGVMIYQEISWSLNPGIGVHLFTRLGQLVTKMTRMLPLRVGKSTICSALKSCFMSKIDLLMGIG